MYQITDKRIGTELYKQGFFGNHLRQWAVDQYLASDVQCKVVLRQRLSAGGGVCVYDLNRSEAVACLKSYLALGHSKKSLYLGEQLPGQPENIVLQGEYAVLGGSEVLFYSTEAAFFRDAMLSAVQKVGSGCRLILGQFMDSRSYERILELAEAWPDHVIEFSTCNEPVGSDNLNTLVWEVRKY